LIEEIFPNGLSLDWMSIAIGALAFAAGIVIAYAAYKAVFAIVERLQRTTVDEDINPVIDQLRRPMKWAFIAMGITVMAQLNSELQTIWEPLAGFLRPALLGWIAYNMVQALTVGLEMRLQKTTDPVSARSRRTRIAVLSRIATFAIIIVTVGLMLLDIPAVRDIGTTLLASAGLAALAVAAAAQPTLKSLISGLQIAMTEPLRLGDLVKIDGTAGRVEEIRMSFVTVRTWDERVLVVPTSRFLDETFENWSRKSEQLTGPVYLHLDPATDIGPIRAEFERFLQEHSLWDGRSQALLMTEAYPESIELRLSMSSKTIGDLWTLRCEVREHMLGWLRNEVPEALIRHRLEVATANERVSG
jgi:small-conductance mechanosensitive channel